MRLPGLHSIHWKVFVFHLAVLILPLGYISWKVRTSIETSYLHSTEEGMIDTAAVVSELYARLYGQFGADSGKVGAELSRVYSNLNETYEIKARLFGFTKAEVDTRLLVYDPGGRVIFDTKGIATNQDFSKWTDVRQALSGQYGSRWELDKPHQRVNIYSTLPVFVGGKIVGAVSVSKSTNRIRNFISRSLENLLVPGLIALVLATVMAYALSAYITRIIWDLASRAERIAAGESNVRLETWTRSELGTLARAVGRMREKLEGKAYVEEMATNLSHELKTPLATIRGSAELLEGPASDDPAARAKFLGNIQTEVARLDRIVSELLKLSRIEAQPAAGEATPIDAAATAREIAEVYRGRAADGGIVFRSEIADEPLPVKVTEQQLKQLLTNLLDNALQFTSAGRLVRLTAKRHEGSVELAISDEGTGIEPELLPKVFDRFFTTENPRTGNRGTGLGLAIAKSIANASSATISVRSELGQGSTFTVIFPSA
ncbi:MAG: two-component system, OmpR family, sensor histidine kinase CreC [Verrucomicrobiota bacterium]|jgi:two-component system sensor histidine kinase CreC